MIHDALQTCIFCVEGKHCVLLPFTQSEAGAYDQDNVVETESVMIGKIVTFWRVKMQIWLIYGILLVSDCRGNLDTAVLHCFYGRLSHWGDTISKPWCILNDLDHLSACLGCYPNISINVFVVWYTSELTRFPYF